MNYLSKTLSNIMAVIGGLMVYGAIGTSDFYVLQLHQREPDHVWFMVAVGVLMMAPLTYRLISESRKENRENEDFM